MEKFGRRCNDHNNPEREARGHVLLVDQVTYCPNFCYCRRYVFEELRGYLFYYFADEHRRNDVCGDRVKKSAERPFTIYGDETDVQAHGGRRFRRGMSRDEFDLEKGNF